MFLYIVPGDEDFLEIHRSASSFIENVLKDDSIIIATTHYHIAEIMNLLRKGNLDNKLREKIFQGFKTPKFKVGKLNMKILDLCFKKNLNSGIHIYDYLVALPLKGIITEIFSADDHFHHKDFQEIAKVTNPLYPWILREGRLPAKVKL